MKLKLVGITLALLAVVVLAAPEDELITGTRAVTAKLYKALTSANNRNVVFSPLSVQTIMSLLASATRDDKKEGVQEIITVMSLPTTEYNRQVAFKKVLGTLKADNDFKAFEATKLYLTPGYTIQDWYKKIGQEVYNSETENVNFGNFLATVQNINKWVAKKTENGITNFVNSGDISTNTRHLLINTLYLKGKWSKPFEAKNNINKMFNSPTSARPVTMMTALKSYMYYEDNDAQYIKLDLLRDGGGAEMVFVLPKQKQGLSTLENNVENLLRTVPFTTEMVQLTLPKFSFTQNIELKTVLQNMGMTKIFNWGRTLEAFNYIVAIADVFQKAFISVDEWGVTAGATSGATVIVDLGQGVKEFTADHPFFYYITVDNAVLYAGRVMDV